MTDGIPRSLSSPGHCCQAVRCPGLSGPGTALLRHWGYFCRVKLENIERKELHQAILFDLWHLAPETISDYFALVVDDDSRPAWLIAYYRAKMKYLHLAQPERGA